MQYAVFTGLLKKTKTNKKNRHILAYLKVNLLCFNNVNTIVHLYSTVLEFVTVVPLFFFLATFWLFLCCTHFKPLQARPSAKCVKWKKWKCKAAAVYLPGLHDSHLVGELARRYIYIQTFCRDCDSTVNVGEQHSAHWCPG